MGSIGERVQRAHTTPMILCGSHFNFSVLRRSQTYIKNSGQWKIDGIFADDKSSYGSVYGPNGERIGGVWGMHNDASNKHAVGVFEGNK